MGFVYGLLIFACMLAWAHPMYYYLKVRKWKPAIIEPKIIRRNLGIFTLDVLFVAVCIGLLFYYIRFRRSINYYDTRFLPTIMWTNFALGWLLRSFWKPRITKIGIVQNGYFYTWDRIQKVQSYNKSVIFTVTNGIAPTSTIKIKVKEDPNIISSKLLEYIKKLEQPADSHVV